MPLEFFPGFSAERLDVLARASRAHGSHIVGAERLLDGADGGAVAGDDEGTAALASREVRANWCRGMNVVFLMVVVERGRRRGARRRAIDVGRAMHTLTDVVVIHVGVTGRLAG